MQGDALPPMENTGLLHDPSSRRPGPLSRTTSGLAHAAQTSKRVAMGIGKEAGENVRQHVGFTWEGVKEVVRTGHVTDDEHESLHGRSTHLFFNVLQSCLILTFLFLYGFAYATGWVRAVATESTASPSARQLIERLGRGACLHSSLSLS